MQQRNPTKYYPSGKYDLQWWRQTGIFYTGEKNEIAGVSANSWEEYINLMHKIPRNYTGRVISPELMTASDISLDDLALSAARKAIRQRVNDIVERSESIPYAEIILGTPEFSSLGNYNALLLINNGLAHVIARKQLITPAESTSFTPGYLSQDSTHNVICADLFNYIEENTAHDIQASCCWATPLVPQAKYNTLPDEERYRNAMIYVLNGIFNNTETRSVTIVDWTPDSTNIAPLNCRATRRF
ncbi:MAG: hypothetical protein ACFNYO_00205 [Candidatus Saccharimonas sp.]